MRVPIRIVKGNNFWLRLEVEKIQFEGVVRNVTPYLLEDARSIKVSLVSSFGKTECSHSVDGSQLTIVGTAKMQLGHYGIEILVVDEHFNNLRYYGANQLIIVNETRDADVPDGVEFDYSIYNLGVLGVFQAVNEYYFDRLDAIITLAERNEEDRIANETQRKSNEQERISKEVQRQSNEEDRKRDELARKSNEQERIGAERTRGSNEDARRTAEEERARDEATRRVNEESRKQAETGRESAESSRVRAERNRANAEIRREEDFGAAIAECREATDAAWGTQTVVGVHFDMEDAILTFENQRTSLVSFSADEEDAVININF